MLNFRNNSLFSRKGAALLLAAGCVTSLIVATSQADTGPMLINVRITPSTKADIIGNVAASCDLIEKSAPGAEHRETYDSHDTEEGRWWLIDNPNEDNPEWSAGWVHANGTWCI